MRAIIKPLDNASLAAASVVLAREDPRFAMVVERYGTPPLWDRPPGFETLMNIILEQQVSLASAKACFDKLNAYIGKLTPETFLEIDDHELRRIGFSRQKAAYSRHLCQSVLSGSLDLGRIHRLPDAEAKAELTKLKGVGEWTSDVYLLMAMLRPDVMPRGDIALQAAYQKLAGLEHRPGPDEFLEVATSWRPLRSVAARLLWHFYLSEKRPRLTKPADAASI